MSTLLARPRENTTNRPSGENTPVKLPTSGDDVNLVVRPVSSSSIQMSPAVLRVTLVSSGDTWNDRVSPRIVRAGDVGLPSRPIQTRSREYSWMAPGTYASVPVGETSKCAP